MRPFTLTLTLSLEEREPMRFAPSPEGEGWGEGEKVLIKQNNALHPVLRRYPHNADKSQDD